MGEGPCLARRWILRVWGEASQNLLGSQFRALAAQEATTLRAKSLGDCNVLWRRRERRSGVRWGINPRGNPTSSGTTKANLGRSTAGRHCHVSRPRHPASWRITQVNRRGSPRGDFSTLCPPLSERRCSCGRPSEHSAGRARGRSRTVPMFHGAKPGGQPSTGGRRECFPR